MPRGLPQAHCRGGIPRGRYNLIVRLASVDCLVGRSHAGNDGQTGSENVCGKIVIKPGGLGNLFRLGPLRIGAFLLHLPNFLRLFWRLLKDPRVGLAPKLILLAMVVYVLVPVDLLPDFLVPLGQLDDIFVIFLGLRSFVKLCPQEAVREHVRAIAAGG